MGKKKDPSLRYYFAKVDFENDYRFKVAEEIIHTQGGTDIECLAVLHVYTTLLSIIHKNGYQVGCTNEMMVNIAAPFRQYGLRVENVDRIITALVHSGFFNFEMFDKYSVLTSFDIQSGWKRAMAAMRRVSTIEAVFVISSEDTPHIFGGYEHIFGRYGHIFNRIGGVDPPISISQSDISQTVIQSSSLTEASANENSETGPGAQSGSEANPLVARAPPLEPPPAQEANPDDEVDLFTRRSPEECAALFLRHNQFRESRYQVMRKFEFKEYPVFDKWVGMCFVDWLKSGKMNQAKDMEEFVKHLMSWFKTIDLTQSPEQFMISQTNKPKRPTPYVSTNNTEERTDFSKTNNTGRMSEGL